MTNRNNGGPAFPATTVNDTDCNLIDPFGSLLPPGSQMPYPGMTLRDWFAGKAIPSMLEIVEDVTSRMGVRGSDEDGYRVAAGMAYKMANAMLKAREE